MLVLTRRDEESIIVGGYIGDTWTPPIEVQIVGIQGGEVRIGVRAPSSVRVDRAETGHSKNNFGTPTDPRTTP